ncbi:MAG TPA: plasmid partitioning protein RepB [Paracoccus sp. (in: a-proteobacteria)]|uniref:plasmid partitioning protein RepB n=1 Tax=Paracoccus sp. TaxID=267 RepID=UPI002C84BC57|nr:plasmid partitioning protein RepB [Paracoccus sp. (in: a-proteobacteria)]HWL58917.1 plasmid partitioning protein RepB [Paracoccus sp. (in: a-proteobacteria)]
MARKDLLKGLMEASAPEEDASPLPRYSRGAIGAVSRGIDDLKRRAVSDIPADLIDNAGLRDRLDDDAPGIEALKESMREYGQQVPVLLRHHPNIEGRYEVVYGRRRVAALKSLGLPVKAMIRQLDDRALVIAQGQENSARKDLSFIEKSLFAQQMTRQGYERKIVCDALMIDKTVLSRMLTVAENLPDELVTAIGSAPSVGRDRWLSMAQRLRPETLSKAVAAAQGETSDQRFEAAFAALMPVRKPAAGPREVRNNSGQPIAEIRASARKTTIEFSGAGREFGAWLDENLEEIHRDWLSNKDRAGE